MSSELGLPEQSRLPAVCRPVTPLPTVGTVSEWGYRKPDSGVVPQLIHSSSSSSSSSEATSAIRHGLFGGLSDFFVVGVGQVCQDLPRLRGTDTGDGADGGKQ